MLPYKRKSFFPSTRFFSRTRLPASGVPYRLPTYTTPEHRTGTLETECHTGVITRATLVLVIELNFKDTFLVVLVQVGEIILTVGNKTVQRALFINQPLQLFLCLVIPCCCISPCNNALAAPLVARPRLAASQDSGKILHGKVKSFSTWSHISCSGSIFRYIGKHL